jgi:hypothetical protein
MQAPPPLAPPALAPRTRDCLRRCRRRSRTSCGATCATYKNTLSPLYSFKTVLSEVIGVTGFVLMGTGAAALIQPLDFTKGPSTQSMLASTIVGLAFGVAIFFMICATGHNNSDQVRAALALAAAARGAVADF